VAIESFNALRARATADTAASSQSLRNRTDEKNWDGN